MAFIETVPEAEATGKLAALYAADLERVGYVANYTRIFSHRPEVYEAWAALNASIKANMDLRRYELATLAAARALRSSYCCLAHGKVLLGTMSERELLELIQADAGLSPAEEALMAFAEKVTLQSHAVTQEDVDGLRAHGFSDPDILDIVLTASARNFFSRVLDALGALPDAAYRDLSPDLLAALSVGRSAEPKPT